MKTRTEERIVMLEHKIRIQLILILAVSAALLATVVIFNKVLDREISVPAIHQGNQMKRRSFISAKSILAAMALPFAIEKTAHALWFAILVIVKSGRPWNHVFLPAVENVQKVPLVRHQTLHQTKRQITWHTVRRWIQEPLEPSTCCSTRNTFQWRHSAKHPCAIPDARRSDVLHRHIHGHCLRQR